MVTALAMSFTGAVFSAGCSAPVCSVIAKLFLLLDIQRWRHFAALTLTRLFAADKYNIICKEMNSQ